MTQGLLILSPTERSNMPCNHNYSYSTNTRYLLHGEKARSRFSLLSIHGLTPSTPAVLNYYCLKGSVPYWCDPAFLIFDIRALRTERQSARMSKIKMVGHTSMAKCKALTGSAVKGLTNYNFHFLNSPMRQSIRFIQRHKSEENPRRLSALFSAALSAIGLLDYF